MRGGAARSNLRTLAPKYWSASLRDAYSAASNPTGLNAIHPRS
jgi:hypothetical protein